MKQRYICAGVLVLISACAAAPEKPPFGTDRPIGVCLVMIQSRDGQAVATIDRLRGDGYARGSFGARLTVDVTGSFGQERRTILVMPDESEIKLTSSLGVPASGAAPSTCEAFAL